MQFMVNKSDGTKEVYYHTKVMGAIAAAMDESGRYEPGIPEQLAEAVTTFLIRRNGASTVSTDEIHSMVEAVLSDTGYDSAALALHEHRMMRQLQRDRLEVIRVLPFSPAGEPEATERLMSDGEPWNKTLIVQDLETNYGIEHYTARCIAGNVEEKVLRMTCRHVTVNLIRELVLNELHQIRQAEKVLWQPPEGLGVEETVATVG
jgi:hypothetical protein